MKVLFAVIQTGVFIVLFSTDAHAGSELFGVEFSRLSDSESVKLFITIILLLLGIGVVETTLRLTREARESGCSRRSISLQLFFSFLAVFLVLAGLLFLFGPIQFRGVIGFWLTFGGSATIFGLAFGLLLFGNYLYENPEKLK